jgi:predicted transcriptional regulator
VTRLASDEYTFELGERDEAEFLEGMAEADRGELLDADEVLSWLSPKILNAAD